MFSVARLIYYLTKLGYRKRRFLLILIDFLTVFLNLGFCFILFKIKIEANSFYLLSSLTSLLTIIIYLITKQYKSLTRYIGSQEVYKLFLRNLLIIFLIKSFFEFSNIKTPNIDFWFVYFILSTVSTSGFRFLARDILTSNFFENRNNTNSIKKEKIVIYGAGSAGVELLSSLRISNRYVVKFFIDDSNYLQKRSINGIPIYNPKILESNKFNIDFILLAIPSATITKKREIISNINKLGFKIMQVPSLEELSTGKVNIDNFKVLKIEELLGRNPIIAKEELIKESIRDKIICITGGGGSIGSELGREICKFNFKKLLIIERSEPSIYKIEKELTDILKNNNKEIEKLTCILGDCTDENFLENIFQKFEIDIIFHSAAYKHVPLVEKNPISGIHNNIKSTFHICSLAKIFKISKVVLISSDKAVRPTNIMGATKRLSEQIIQCFAEEVGDSPQTIFTAVRFGNVLGSSGSVVPLFEKQIKNGGPITLTHKEIIRYFMTINEAAQLVIQASSLSNGGEIFLLEMGQPILIRDLATKMIRNSGLTVKDKYNINGDIEIEITGLRPGEKLYEELLIDGESLPTNCSGIYYVKEEHIKAKELWIYLNDLFKSLSKNSLDESLQILSRVVPEWKIK